MLLASAVDITIGWVWHTAYRARWHWKLKREGALIAAGCRCPCRRHRHRTLPAWHSPHAASPRNRRANGTCGGNGDGCRCASGRNRDRSRLGRPGGGPASRRGWCADGASSRHRAAIPDHPGSRPARSIRPTRSRPSCRWIRARKRTTRSPARSTSALAMPPARTRHRKKKAKPVKTAAAKQPAPKPKPSKKQGR